MNFSRVHKYTRAQTWLSFKKSTAPKPQSFREPAMFPMTANRKCDHRSGSSHIQGPGQSSEFRRLPPYLGSRTTQRPIILRCATFTDGSRDMAARKPEAALSPICHLHRPKSTFLRVKHGWIYEGIRWNFDDISSYSSDKNTSGLVVAVSVSSHRLANNTVGVFSSGSRKI
jgi:hypothetical protein